MLPSQTTTFGRSIGSDTRFLCQNTKITEARTQPSSHSHFDHGAPNRCRLRFMLTGMRPAFLSKSKRTASHHQLSEKARGKRRKRCTTDICDACINDPLFLLLHRLGPRCRHLQSRDHILQLAEPAGSLLLAFKFCFNDDIL